MYSKPTSLFDLTSKPHPGRLSDFAEWYRRDNDDGSVLLNSKGCNFLSEMLISALDATEIHTPTIGFVGQKSVASILMADQWIKSEKGVIISDPEIAKFAASGYLEANERGFYCDQVYAPAFSPAFGQINLHYFRALVIAKTHTGLPCVITYCQPLDDLAKTLRLDTRYQQPN